MLSHDDSTGQTYYRKLKLVGSYLFTFVYSCLQTLVRICKYLINVT